MLFQCVRCGNALTLAEPVPPAAQCPYCGNVAMLSAHPAASAVPPPRLAVPPPIAARPVPPPIIRPAAPTTILPTPSPAACPAPASTAPPEMPDGTIVSDTSATRAADEPGVTARRFHTPLNVAAAVAAVAALFVVGILLFGEGEPRPVAAKANRTRSARLNRRAPNISQEPAPVGDKPASDTPKAEPPEENTKPVRDFDHQPWQKADLVMVNPTHYAVALEDLGGDEYVVVSKAEDDEASLAIAAAADARVPVVARDRALSRRIYRSVAVGDKLPEPLALEVSRLFCHQEFVPAGDRFVSFKELKGARRLGFLLDEQPERITFRELISPGEERLERVHILPGSLRLDVKERELTEARLADWLDYAIVKVCQGLRSPKGEKTHVHLVLRETKADISDGEMTSAIDDFERQRIYDANDAANRGSIWHQILGELAREPARRGEKRELRKLRAAHRALARVKEALDGEIRDRLIRLRVPVLEREELEALLAERKLATGEDADEFRKRKDEIDPRRETEAGFQRLFCASHLLLPQVRFPRKGGQYELDLRLIDVNTGQILWSGQDDRFAELKAEPVEQLGRPLCLPAGGPLVAIEFAPSGTPAKSPHAGAHAFAPLKNPLLGKPSLDTADVAGSPAVLARLLPTTGSGLLDVRDLFGWQRATIPAAAIKQSKPVRSLADVPPNEELRYLVWRIARAALPPAGDILSLEQTTIKISLGRDDGLKPADRLRVVRRSKEDGSKQVLDCEPSVSQVSDDSAIAVVPSGGASLQPGDMVLVKRPRRPKVAIFPAEVSAEEPSLLRELSILNNAQRARLMQAVTLHGQSMAAQLRAGLERFDVPLIDAESLTCLTAKRVRTREPLDDDRRRLLARESGATHAVFLGISPRKAVVSTRCQLTMTVVDVENQQIADQFRFELSSSQLDRINAWQP